jgi:hypothetical protein
MERAMCQLMGYRAVNSLLSSCKRCFGKLFLFFFFCSKKKQP